MVLSLNKNTAIRHLYMAEMANLILTVFVIPNQVI